MKHLTVSIEGMSCDHCVRAVEKALSAPGVENRAVRVGAAELDYDPGKVTPEALLAAIGEEGFAAKVV
ncbi:MAG: heavy-metal-associated domain-containing protein [Terriglobales bacterium]